MQTIRRQLINICSDDLPRSRDFYVALFDFNIDYDSDWFVHLISKDRQLELGIIDRTNAIVPQDFQNHPQGFYVTFVVDDVDALYALAQEKGLEVHAPPEDTFYGQRRLLLKDPNGVLVDISAPIPGFGPQ